MSMFVQSLGASVVMLLIATQKVHAIPEAKDDRSLLAIGDMNCVVGSPFNSSAETKITTLEYWYGVESTDNTTSFMPAVENSIFETSIQTVSWCYQYGGGRRVEEAGKSYFEDKDGRRLGIMTITGAPQDYAFNNRKCYPKID